MAWWSTNAPRKDQIADIALELLGEIPLAQLTTRAIAARAGMSQPALFRHFTSREAVLVAVATALHARLEAHAEALLAHGGAPLDACTELAARLEGEVARRPGIPRLLFADVALDLPELRRSVGRIVSMQRALVAALVAEAQARGEADLAADPEVAGALFVAALQGAFLRRAVEGEATAVGPHIALWRRAVAASAGDPAAQSPWAVVPTHTLAHIDARPILAKGTDPLAVILAAVERLAPGGVIAVTAPFRPRPLEALLARRGFTVSVVVERDGEWTVAGRDPTAGGIVDLTDLEAPLPLERTIASARALPSGTCAALRVPRYPHLLLPHLAAIGARADVAVLADGTALVVVARP